MTEVRLEAREAQPYASIRTQATLAEWGAVNDLVDEVADWLAAKGIAMTGPLVYRYWRVGDMEVQFDVEVGWLTDRQVDPDGRVQAGEIPPGTYLVATHVGHPDELPGVFDAMLEWADKNDAPPASQVDGATVVWEGWFELFLTNPEEEPNLNKWRTDALLLTSERAMS